MAREVDPPPSHALPRGTLSRGTRLGAYEIESMLGAGGMGEVYRARDTRLDRSVALKVLSSGMTHTPGRLQRFAHEARAISQFSHPHICALYDVGEAVVPEPGSAVPGAAGPPTTTAVPFLVMELLEGETLAKRLARGPLPIDEVLRYAGQIADALDTSHRHGVVHRDLKPANVMLTKAGAKLLDFGLAVPAHPADDHGTPANTRAETLTAEGVVVGTLAYTAPERLEGADADARSDVFAFGAVLYEMVTAKRAFGGGNESAVAAILDSHADPLGAIGGGVPPQLAHVIRVCLAKDPDERWQSARDIRRQLEWIANHEFTSTQSLAPVGGRRSFLPLGAVVAAVALLAFVAIVAMRNGGGADRPGPVRTRFTVAPPPGASFIDSAIRLSPDGRALAIMALGQDRTRRLWLHSFDTGETQVLATAGAGASVPPTWSPDGRFLAFSADGKIKKVAVSGGSAQTVANASGTPGDWGPDDVLLFVSRGVVMRVRASGGSAVPLTALDAARQEIGHYMPRFLPDGRRFLYQRLSLTDEGSGIYVGATDLAPDKQSLERLVSTTGYAAFAPSPADVNTGHLLFNRSGTLLAQPFSAEVARVTGEPFPVAERLDETNTPPRTGAFTVSSGVLAYRQVEPLAGTPVWVSRGGSELAAISTAPLPHPEQVRLSPDQSRLAAIVDGDVWIYDLNGRPPIKLSSGGNKDHLLWTRDGLEIVYADRLPPIRLQSIRVDVGSKPAPASPLGHFHPHGWSRDGRDIVTVLNSYSPTGWDILAIPWRGQNPAQSLVATPSDDGMFGAAVSPDGRWLAYTLNATGEHEIWVRSLDESGGSVRVSANGGTDPQWSDNGDELYYVEGPSRMMAVAVHRAPAFSFAPPRLLFSTSYPIGDGRPNQSYDVTADGRFLMMKPAAAASTLWPITVVLNWTADRSH